MLSGEGMSAVLGLESIRLDEAPHWDVLAAAVVSSWGWSTQDWDVEHSKFKHSNSKFIKFRTLTYHWITIILESPLARPIGVLHASTPLRLNSLKCPLRSLIQTCIISLSIRKMEKSFRMALRFKDHLQHS